MSWEEGVSHKNLSCKGRGRLKRTQRSHCQSVLLSRGIANPCRNPDCNCCSAVQRLSNLEDPLTERPHIHQPGASNTPFGPRSYPVGEYWPSATIALKLDMTPSP